MFKKVILLNPKDHAGLQVASTTGYQFAADQMFLPIVYTEMADAAREFPIVFLKGNTGLFVLTGLEQDTNAYVAEDGNWLATYVPAKLRAFPFALVQNPHQAEQFAIALDTEAPQVMSQQGHVLFENGLPGTFLKRRMELLEKMKKAEPMTQHLVKVLQDSGLLIDRAIRIQKPGKKDSQITGMQVIDEQALNQLPHEAFNKLREEGALPLIYAHLLSMANLRQGVLAGKYPQLAANKQTDMSDLFHTETIRFN